ncbi:hypothetical protein GCM10007385_24870 [Tateyamaria omphalii]|uniref:S8 family serine peptidase n=1 Tax=Tateyamaria omphalii TaxID=299262 RepID=UPI001679F3F7|nr:S8 family serine peptidase [Tateyamaria omphalii]GGX55360.1 hypothetical protein GCM10007385_24870 [Tateyamaria omphalii]
MTFKWYLTNRPPVTDARTDHRLLHLEALEQNLTADWFSVLIKLEQTSIDAFLDSLPAEIADSVHIPELYDSDDRAEVPTIQHVSGFARGAALRALNEVDNTFGVSALRLGGQVLGGLNLDATFDEMPLAHVPEDSIVTAVIDDAIALGHNLFASGICKTRIASALVMSAPTLSGGKFSRGQVFHKAKLDRFLKECTVAGLLDEDRFYRLTGQIDHSAPGASLLAHRRTHGTHVAGLAAGFPRETAPDNRPILCVTLPAEVTRDVSGRNLLPDLAYALIFVSRQSRRIRAGDRPAPVVCNFSYGSYGGPHDGTGDIDQLFERFVNSVPKQKRRVTLPAGNAYERDIHAKLSFDGCSRQTCSVGLNVPVSDLSASHVQFWLPVSSSSTPDGQPAFSVILPSGYRSPEFNAEPGASMVLQNAEGQVVAQLSYSYERRPTQRGVVSLTVYPTATFNSSDPVAPAGHWRVEMALSTEAEIHAWIDRDEDLPGYRPRGRQMHFDANDTDQVSSDSTLSGFACGVSPVVVGAVDSRMDAMSAYSAAGPITPTVNSPDIPRPGPDTASVSDTSPVLAGIYSAGSRCGSMVRMSGTSVAAPQIAQFMVNGLAAGQQADRPWVQSQARQRNPNIDRTAYPLGRAGEGPIKVATGIRSSKILSDTST